MHDMDILKKGRSVKLFYGTGMVYSFSGGSDEVFNEYEKENLRVLLKILDR